MAETLCRSLQIAQEARKNSIVVTYDLAIVKIAMQIQKEESPVYGNIFVSLGSFHIEMAYFKAVGKIISQSGGPFLLQECQVSIKSFLSGLSCNKCKRLHEILATASEVMHFKTFLDLQEDKEEELLEIISNQITIKEDVSESYSREMNEILNRCCTFRKLKRGCMVNLPSSGFNTCV